jgi:hypothetical protein
MPGPRVGAAAAVIVDGCTVTSGAPKKPTASQTPAFRFRSQRQRAAYMQRAACKPDSVCYDCGRFSACAATRLLCFHARPRVMLHCARRAVASCMRRIATFRLLVCCCENKQVAVRFRPLTTGGQRGAGRASGPRTRTCDAITRGCRTISMGWASLRRSTSRLEPRTSAAPAVTPPKGRRGDRRRRTHTHAHHITHTHPHPHTSHRRAHPGDFDGFLRGLPGAT